MHSDLVELGWTEEHWSRICTAVTEEAQKARVAAQFLSIVGPLDPTTVAIPTYQLNFPAVTVPVPGSTTQEMEVDSDPTLHLTKIAVNVHVRLREAADPDLSAALTMFRRAANYVGRIEDALVFNGRPLGLPPATGLKGIPPVYRVTGKGASDGLLPGIGPTGARLPSIKLPPAGGASPGDRVVSAVIQSINALDAAGQLGPYACVLSPQLFQDVCTPNSALVLPRDRIMPFLQGPLVRSSAIDNSKGVVVALSANPIELVVASDIHVRYLQTTEEPRLVFQVSERIALRIKEFAAIVELN